MTDSSHISPGVRSLLERGVHIPHPGSVWVDGEVDSERVHPKARLCPGTRLSGADLCIGPDAVIGGETPATVENCQVGPGVELKGGYFAGSVFLKGSAAGSSAHIRPGCLFEEQASVAHAVGCKQTILFPFATLGSLINFCDALLAGGTHGKNHSEIGSSFIHFNFTPHGDKATPSLLGDVARGVWLDQAPVFLGGQGGLVGPVIAEYGVVQAAGSVGRGDLDAPGHLYRDGGVSEAPRPYTTGRVRDPLTKLRKNLRYVGNLSALRLWYRMVRPRVMEQTATTRWCLEGAETLLAGAMAERRKRLSYWAELVTAGADAPAVFADWDRVEDCLDRALRDGNGVEEALAAAVAGCPPGYGNYVAWVNEVPEREKARIRDILQMEINRFAEVADVNPRENPR